MQFTTSSTKKRKINNEIEKLSVFGVLNRKNKFRKFFFTNNILRWWKLTEHRISEIGNRDCVTATKPFLFCNNILSFISNKLLFVIMNKQICVYFKMWIYLVSGEPTLGIRFLIVKPAFIVQFFRFALSVS